MVVCSGGVLEDHRLGACSDDAQLFFPWLFIASNGFGRLKWSYSELVTSAFPHLRDKPSPEQLQKCLEEYRSNYLIFVYRTDDAELWGQWIVDKRHFPTYKTAKALRSPAPPEPALAAFKESAARARTEQNAASVDIIRVADFENLPKSIPSCENVPHGSGIGVDGGKGEDTSRSAPRAQRSSSRTNRQLIPSRSKGPNPTTGMRDAARERKLDAAYEVEPADPVDRKNMLWAYRGAKEKNPELY